MTPPAHDHEMHARGQVARCGVLTISDTRTPETDTGGRGAAEMLRAAGHNLVHLRIVPDEPADIAAVLDDWVGGDEVNCVITTGGTGIAARDRTIGVVRERIDLLLPGFGEIFRQLSYEQVGPAAVLSRSLAGITGTPFPTAIFALPGSPAAVSLALEKLILPLLPHLLSEMNKGR